MANTVRARVRKQMPRITGAGGRAAIPAFYKRTPVLLLERVDSKRSRILYPGVNHNGDRMFYTSVVQSQAVRGRGGRFV